MKKRIYGNRFYVVNNRISSNQFWLEANTEQSESNPGRSLGLYKARRDRLSGRQYPTDMLLHLRLSPHALKIAHG